MSRNSFIRWVGLRLVGVCHACIAGAIVPAAMALISLAIPGGYVFSPDRAFKPLAIIACSCISLATASSGMIEWLKAKLKTSR